MKETVPRLTWTVGRRDCTAEAMCTIADQKSQVSPESPTRAANKRIGKQGRETVGGRLSLLKNMFAKNG